MVANKQLWPSPLRPAAAPGRWRAPATARSTRAPTMCLETPTPVLGSLNENRTSFQVERYRKIQTHPADGSARRSLDRTKTRTSTPTAAWTHIFYVTWSDSTRSATWWRGCEYDAVGDISTIFGSFNGKYQSFTGE